jgi:hypothetical protein
MLREVENLRIEFKQEIDLSKGSDKGKRYDELAKDILGLVNTAGRASDDYAYLVIGAGDKVLPDGSRSYHPVTASFYKQKTLLDIVNVRCIPEVPELLYREIELDDRRYGVVVLPPSPHVHSAARDLETPKGNWRKNSILLRSGEGNIQASEDDIRLMRQQKKAWSVGRANFRIGGIEDVTQLGWNADQLAEALIALDFAIFKDLNPEHEGT